MLSLSASSLPEELWTVIIAKLPCRDRFRMCSMVCSKLHRAAAAATTDLSVADCAADKSRSFELYLAHHGRHLTSLDLTLFDVVKLPCPHLSQLQLTYCAVQLGFNSDSPGILAACSALTYLEIVDCGVLDSTSGLSALAAVPNLQHLMLESLSDCSLDGTELSMPSSLLMHVPKLTFLHLEAASGECLQDSFLQLSSLTDLHSLALLPHRSATDACSVTPNTVPGFSCLTALTSMCLTQCGLDPGILQNSTQLQSLSMHGVTLVSDPGNAPAASATLLSCIARMAGLEQLSVSLKDTQWTDDMTADTAFTASSKLQTLKLIDGSLPRGTWQAAFPAGRTCSHLKVLHGPEWHYYVLNAADEAVLDQDRGVPVSAATAADLARLVCCCPALQDCSLCLAEDVTLVPLAQLTSLSRLSIQHVGGTCLQSLPALTQLRTLSVKVSRPVTPRHIMGLTALRKLTFLYVDTNAVLRVELEDWDRLRPWISSTDQDNPDVWLQLLKQCAGNQACQPAVIEELVQHVAEQQKVCSQQQQRIEALEHHSMQQQQCIEGLQKKVEQQQQSAAASVEPGEAAELRGRMQALEGQVRQLMQTLQHRDV